jgi:hypothetical protein
MLERGEEWLDHAIQLLAYCEQMGFIYTSYTQWCEHAIEGAYDWIESISGDGINDSHPLEEMKLSDENSSEVTEERLLQKLMSDDDTEILPAICLKPVQVEQTYHNEANSDQLSPGEIMLSTTAEEAILKEEEATPPVETIQTITEDVAIPITTLGEASQNIIPDTIVLADAPIVIENETEIQSNIVESEEDSQRTSEDSAELAVPTELEASQFIESQLFSPPSSNEEHTEAADIVLPSTEPKEHPLIDEVENKQSVDVIEGEHEGTSNSASETIEAVDLATIVERFVAKTSDSNTNTLLQNEGKPRQRGGFLWHFLKMFTRLSMG